MITKAMSASSAPARIEIAFRLLQVRLPRGAFLVAAGDEWADGQLGESDRGDVRLDW